MRKQLRRLRGACLKWRHLLWLNNYEFDIRFASEGGFDKRESKENHGEDSAFTIYAVTESSPEYMTARIEAKESETRHASDDALDSMACHEVIHVLMGPLDRVSWEMLHELPAQKREIYKKWRQNELEELASKLTNILRVLYKAPRGA